MTRSLPRSTSLLFSTAVMSAVITAQDFAPLNPNSRKLFAALDHSAVFSLSFDPVVVSGDTTSYYNFRTMRDTMVASNCGWWTEQACRPMDQPTWAGARIEAAADGVHLFHNVFGQELRFDFNTEPGSETVIYADVDQQFILHHEGSGNYTVLGQIEGVQQWSVLHLDEFGTVINSPLHNAEVNIGETMGLLRFFRIDSFPMVLEPVELIGQADPPLGLYEITPAVLEDHQPGDEVQFHETYDLYNGPPWADYDRYRKYVYLSRQDMPTEVTYSVHQEVFNADGTGLTVDTVTLAFDRTTILGTIPFEQFNGAWPHLREEGYCGMPLWTLMQPLHNGMDYCADENCWGGTDTNGPPVEGANTYVAGLGTFDRAEVVFGMPGYNLHYSMVYFKKNGVECFQEVVMGTSGTSGGPPAFQLSPNPTEGLMTISSQEPVVGAEVRDAHGRVIANDVLDAQGGKLDMRSVANGLYLVRLRFVDGGVGTRRVVVGR